MPASIGNTQSPEERREWELECFGLLLSKLGKAVHSFRSIRRELRGVRLEGQCPNTTIVVTIYDLERLNAHEMHFRLWTELTEGEQGTRQDPEDVASLFAINASEP
jgi:hypothetical protein